MSLSGSLSSVTVSSSQAVQAGERIVYAVTGTFVATWSLEFSDDGGQSWRLVRQMTTTQDASGYTATRSGLYRFRCSARTSGTITYSLTVAAIVLRELVSSDGVVLERVTRDGVETVRRPSQKRIFCTGKIGTTAGWVVAPADNLGLMATLPASQTASTLVVRIPGLKVGDIITGFNLIGQIESAGASATLDAALRKLTAAAADVVDSLVGSMTQLAVTADTAIAVANSAVTGLAEVVGEDETFYVLITGTTAALTDVALQGVAITVTEA